MSLPNVSIEIAQGGLGRVPSVSDGIVGLLLTGSLTRAASSSLELYTTPQVIYDLSGLERIGLSETTNAVAYTQVIDFYNQAGEGSELWLQLVGKDETFESLFAVGGKAEQLASSAGGRINLLGVSHGELRGASLKTAVGGLLGNVHAAVALAQAFAERQLNKSEPLQVILSGNEMSSLTALSSYEEGRTSRVSLLISTRKVGSKQAALGVVLGLAARQPVQRSLARVKNGALRISEAGFTNGEAIESNTGIFSALHSKRYLFFRNYSGLAGYYIADDLNLVSASKDTASIAAQRVMDKAIRLTYKSYVEEIAEEVFLENGKLAPANIKYMEGKIENTLNEAMTNLGEVSEVVAFIDPQQDVLATDRLDVELRITPVGYAKRIRVRIGFSNPQNR